MKSTTESTPMTSGSVGERKSPTDTRIASIASAAM